MKILTLNTWQEKGPWQERWEVTLEGIEQFRPDIVGFQELFNASWAAEVQRRAGFSNLLFSDERCGNVLYTNYSVKSWGIVTLAKSPLEEYFRYVLWAELDVKGRKLVVFNTHFSWMLEDGATRMKQAGEILKLVEAKAPRDESILVGDLNAPPASPEIEGLIQKGNFRDLFFEKHPRDPLCTWDNHNPYVANAFHKLPNRRIDFVLARGSGPLLKKLVSCNIVFIQPNPRGIWASDHYGVLAEF